MSNLIFEREVRRLERQLQSGDISEHEYDELLEDLERSYREAMELAVEEAADNERERW